MCYRDLCTVLLQNGWNIVSQRGSHVKLKKSDVKNSIIIPYHGSRDLSPGVVRSAERTAGLLFRHNCRKGSLFASALSCIMSNVKNEFRIDPKLVPFFGATEVAF